MSVTVAKLVKSALFALILMAGPASALAEGEAADAEPQWPPPEGSGAGAGAGVAGAPGPVGNLSAGAPRYDDGSAIDIKWTASAGEAESASPKVTSYLVLRSNPKAGPVGDLVGKDPMTLAPKPDAFTLVKVVPATGAGSDYSLRDQPKKKTKFVYMVFPMAGTVYGRPALVGPATTETAYWNGHHWLVALTVLIMGVLIAYFLSQAKKRGKEMYIRRIAGIDAMDEAIGRATEMGRPVLYVPGVEEIQDLQTIASILILGHVAETVAKYGAEIKVPCMIPLVMAISEEVVREGFVRAGHPEAHKPRNIMFISSEQFAFTAGTNGIIIRDKPATNIYLGRFFAESLMLAETGYINRSIQIAGTAEITQLPFFIAACDYTIIGEELFAVSAYLSREPRLLSSLKATDYFKALLILFILFGTVWMTYFHSDPARQAAFMDLFFPGS